jgi:hypothetical protein
MVPPVRAKEEGGKRRLRRRMEVRKYQHVTVAVAAAAAVTLVSPPVVERQMGAGGRMPAAKSNAARKRSREVAGNSDHRDDLVAPSAAEVEAERLGKSQSIHIETGAWCERH